MHHVLMHHAPYSHALRTIFSCPMHHMLMHYAPYAHALNNRTRFEGALALLDELRQHQ
jgi:hypothetical protein